MVYTDTPSPVPPAKAPTLGSNSQMPRNSLKESLRWMVCLSWPWDLPEICPTLEQSRQLHPHSWMLSLPSKTQAQKAKAAEGHPGTAQGQCSC